jgi:hypothetical protein
VVRQEAEIIYLAIPLRNVGAGLAMLRGYRLEGELGSSVAHDPRGVARHLRGDPAPQSQAFSPQQRDLLISTSRVGFWQAALRDPETPLHKEIVQAIGAQVYGSHRLYLQRIHFAADGYHDRTMLNPC